MSSVRDRIEGEQYLERQKSDAAKAQADAAARAQQDAQPSYIPRPSRSSLVVGNPATMSTREHAERAAAQEPETLTPPRSAEATTGFDGEDNIARTSVRDRAERQRSLAELQAIPENSRTAEQQFFIDQEAELQARYKAERDQRAHEQAEVHRKNEEQLAFNRRMLPVRLLLDQHFANDRERQTIWRIATEHPEFDNDKLYSVLLELRRCIAAAPPRPGVKK